jgi:hypothetical protein
MCGAAAFSAADDALRLLLERKSFCKVALTL